MFRLFLYTCRKASVVDQGPANKCNHNWQMLTDKQSLVLSQTNYACKTLLEPALVPGDWCLHDFFSPLIENVGLRPEGRKPQRGSYGRRRHKEEIICCHYTRGLHNPLPISTLHTRPAATSGRRLDPPPPPLFCIRNVDSLWNLSKIRGSRAEAEAEKGKAAILNI